MNADWSINQKNGVCCYMARPNEELTRSNLKFVCRKDSCVLSLSPVANSLVSLGVNHLLFFFNSLLVPNVRLCEK